MTRYTAGLVSSPNNRGSVNHSVETALSVRAVSCSNVVKGDLSIVNLLRYLSHDRGIPAPASLLRDMLIMPKLCDLLQTWSGYFQSNSLTSNTDVT